MTDAKILTSKILLSNLVEFTKYKIMKVQLGVYGYFCGSNSAWELFPRYLYIF